MKTHLLLSEFGFALESFLIDGQSRNLRAKTLDNYRQQLTWFLRYVQESGFAALEEISPQSIRAYFVYLRCDLEWAPASVHSAARPIKTFFAYCVRDEILNRSPMDKVRMPVNEQPTKIPFTNDEIQRIIAATKNQRDKSIVFCLLDSGCRVSEFVSWNVGDVDLSTGAVHLRYTKNRENRTVFLGKHARKELAKHYMNILSTQADAPIWCSHGAYVRLKANGVNQLLRRIGNLANVYPSNPHRFRHTFAVTYLRNGGDIFTLQRILGHKSLEMVRRYLALTYRDLQEAHGKFGVVDNL